MHHIKHFLVGKEVVVTEKRDGENTTIYSDGYHHARSLDGNRHPSQDWLKAFVAKFWWNMHPKHRLVGEYLYATHSIYYDNLKSFFELFSVWKDDLCLSWDETLHIAEDLGLVTVPVIYRGIVYQDMKETLSVEFDAYCSFHKREIEGYVIRLAGGYSLDNANQAIAKFVRKGHVANDKHWTTNWDATKVNKLNIGYR